jgi:hypothetical protein
MAVLDELKAIEERDGILYPQAVVDFARDPETHLHNKFEWDDAKAGEGYRIWQARQLISVQVLFLNDKDGKEKQSPAFVSLTTDRALKGGYRSMVTVLSDNDMRVKMLRDARRELGTFRKKYQDLVELADVFQEIEKILA